MKNVENILLENIAKYKKRYEYYNDKNNEEKSNEYISLLLLEIDGLLALKNK
jgi:hypothetical protein